MVQYVLLYYDVLCGATNQAGKVNLQSTNFP